MNKPVIKNIKDIVAYLRPLFDRKSYKNMKFHQGIIIVVLIIVAMWLISGIYFTGKIFSFVTERVTSYTEKAESNISKGRDYIGYTGKRMKEYWDEKHTQEELAKEWQQEANLKKIEAKKQELERFISWLQTASYEEINKKDYKVDNAAEYLKNCSNNISSWIREREVIVLTRRRLVTKYEQDLAAKTYWDNGEKQAMKEYIAEVANLDTNYSPDYLLKILKEKQPSEVKIKGEYQDFDEMHSCIHVAEKLVPALYYNFHNTDLTSVKGGGLKFFPYLQHLTQVFQIDLDLTIPLILTQEADALSRMVPFDTGNNVFEAMKEELEGRVAFPEYAHKAMVIFENTNQKLAQINPDNMGFKTNAYKYRMEQYAFWQKQREEGQKQQIELQKQKEEKDIKLAEEKLKQITQARKAEEKKLNWFKSDSRYISIDIIEKYEKKIKALMQEEEKAVAHVKSLKEQRKIVPDTLKKDNQPEEKSE